MFLSFLLRSVYAEGKKGDLKMAISLFCHSSPHSKPAWDLRERRNRGVWGRVLTVSAFQVKKLHLLAGMLSEIMQAAVLGLPLLTFHVYRS